MSNVDVVGQGSLQGSVLVNTSFFAPALTLVYHFDPIGRFQPYVGAGGQALVFYNERTEFAPGFSTKVDNAIGPTIQAGIDLNVGGGFSVNFDVKKSFISTDVSLNAPSTAIRAKDVDVDPLIIGVGLGYRF